MRERCKLLQFLYTLGGNQRERRQAPSPTCPPEHPGHTDSPPHLSVWPSMALRAGTSSLSTRTWETVENKQKNFNLKRQTNKQKRQTYNLRLTLVKLFTPILPSGRGPFLGGGKKVETHMSPKATTKWRMTQMKVQQYQAQNFTLHI